MKTNKIAREIDKSVQYCSLGWAELELQLWIDNSGMKTSQLSQISLFDGHICQRDNITRARCIQHTEQLVGECVLPLQAFK